MDFLIEEKSFDIATMKFSHDMETASAVFYIKSMESAGLLGNDSYMEATWENIKKTASEIFQRFYEAVKKFFKEIKIKIDTAIQQQKVNKKLEELKDILAKKKSRILNKKYNYFDIKKYKMFYTDFINRYIAELKSGLNKNFKTVKEYENWKESMLNKLSDFNYKLSDEEQWKLSISINSAVQLTEEEVKNRDKNLKMVEESGTQAVKNLEKYYKKIDTEKSVVNFEKNQIKVFSMHNSFIGLVCSKIAQLMKTVANIITKHTFACITALIVILIAA